ncbi:hypothetical protein JCM18750_01800 [Halostagnicola bangensis]
METEDGGFGKPFESVLETTFGLLGAVEGDEDAFVGVHSQSFEEEYNKGQPDSERMRIRTLVAACQTVIYSLFIRKT